MADIILQAYPAKPSFDGGFQVVMHLDGRPAPLPRRVVSVKTTPEALAALDAFKAEAAATGEPMAVCMRLKDGSRAPNGFKAATAKIFFHRVNV